MINRWYICKGECVQVLCRWAGKGPRNVLVRTEGGRMFVRPFRGLRVCHLPPLVNSKGVVVG